MARHKCLPCRAMQLLIVPGTISRHNFHNFQKCDGGYHFFGNAENFFNIGNAMGKAMLELLPAAKP